MTTKEYNDNRTKWKIAENVALAWHLKQIGAQQAEKSLEFLGYKVIEFCFSIRLIRVEEINFPGRIITIGYKI